VDRMRDALDRADRTLALISAAYLASPYCTDEWNGAFLHDPDGHIPLVSSRPWPSHSRRSRSTLGRLG
jgi:hypothetical protein